MAEDEEKVEATEEKKDKPPEAKPISLPPSKESEPAKEQEYPPPPGYAQQGYGPAPEPFFRASNLQKILAMFLLLGVIVLLVGAILTAASDFTEVDDSDSEDLARNLDAAGHLVGAIGLFLIALLAVFLPMLLITDLSDKQKTLLMYIMVAVIIGFAFMATV